MPLKPGNKGPSHQGPGSNPTIIIFPAAHPIPAVYRDNEPVAVRQETYWSNKQLQDAGTVPSTESEENLIRIWVPKGLQPLTEIPGHNQQWSSYEEYRHHLTTTARAPRTAGIFVDSPAGKPNTFRLALTGAAHRANITTPQPIVDLFTSLGYTATPGFLKATIKPSNIRLKANKPYSGWITMEQAGFNGTEMKIPNPVNERVFCRYKMISPKATNFSLSLTVEYIVIPDEMIPNGIQPQLDSELDSPAVPTLLLWKAKLPYKWEKTFNYIEGVHNMKTPIPACTETQTNHLGHMPSEWTLRRISHDLFISSLEGHYHDNLHQCLQWFSEASRPYYHTNEPVLIVPQVPDTPKEIQANITENDETPTLEDHGTETRSKPYRTWTDHKSANHPDPGKSTMYIQATANGKYRSKRNCSGLISKYQNQIPELNNDEAADLATITQASIANNTANLHASIQRTVQKLFPERDNMFHNNKERDQLLIVARLRRAQYKEKTIIQYMAAYPRLVANNGGTNYPRPPEMRDIVKGLRNLAHNPAQIIAAPTKKAYSIEALRLVAQKGAHLMKKTEKWNKYRCALFRATILLMFFGRLRSAEVLGDTNNEFDYYNHLLYNDVIIDRNRNTGQPEAIHLLLRNCKYQEQNGALVVIPAINTDYCPVAAMTRYLKLRQELVTDNTMPLLMTDFLWKQGDSKPVSGAPGIYTKHRFRKDTKAAVKLLVAEHPNLSEVMSYLITHSLRSGIPTEMQIIDDVPEEIRLQLGRWHSSAHTLYMKNLQQAAKTAKYMETALVKNII